MADGSPLQSTIRNIVNSNQLRVTFMLSSVGCGFSIVYMYLCVRGNTFFPFCPVQIYEHCQHVNANRFIPCRVVALANELRCSSVATPRVRKGRIYVAPNGVPCSLSDKVYRKRKWLKGCGGSD